MSAISNPKKIQISHFQRRTMGKVFSLESIGQFIREELQDHFRFEKKINYFYSIGFFRRFADGFLAKFREGDINHIMGDIHYLAIFLDSRKTILTIADCVSLNRLNGFKQKIIMFFWYYIPVKRSSVVVVISEFVKNELLGYVKCDPSKIKVIHVPLLTDINLNLSLKLSSKPVKNILHIGSTENKNLFRHVDALQDLPINFIFVGEPSAEQENHIINKCFSYQIGADISDSDLIDLYDSSDLLLFASTYEGFGMPIIEAQSRGLPVITSNICSMPEIAGGGACLVNPYDVEDIKAAILEISINHDLRKELIKEGFNNITRFQPNKISEEYAKLYYEINK